MIATTMTQNINATHHSEHQDATPQANTSRLSAASIARLPSFDTSTSAVRSRKASRRGSRRFSGNKFSLAVDKSNHSSIDRNMNSTIDTGTHSSSISLQMKSRRRSQSTRRPSFQLVKNRQNTDDAQSVRSRSIDTTQNAIRRNTVSIVSQNHDLDDTGPAQRLALNKGSQNQRRVSWSSLAPGTSMHTQNDGNDKGSGNQFATHDVHSIYESLKKQKAAAMSHISSNVSDDRQKQQFTDPSISSFNSKAAYPIRRAEEDKRNVYDTSMQFPKSQNHTDKDSLKMVSNIMSEPLKSRSQQPETSPHNCQERNGNMIATTMTQNINETHHSEQQDATPQANTSRLSAASIARLPSFDTSAVRSRKASRRGSRRFSGNKFSLAVDKSNHSSIDRNMNSTIDTGTHSSSISLQMKSRRRSQSRTRRPSFQLVKNRQNADDAQSVGSRSIDTTQDNQTMIRLRQHFRRNTISHTAANSDNTESFGADSSHNDTQKHQSIPQRLQKAIRRNTVSIVTQNHDSDDTGPAQGLAPNKGSHSTLSSHQNLNQRHARRRSSVASGTSLNTKNNDNLSIPSFNSKADYPIRRAEEDKRNVYDTSMQFPKSQNHTDKDSLKMVSNTMSESLKSRSQQPETSPHNYQERNGNMIAAPMTQNINERHHSEHQGATTHANMNTQNHQSTPQVRQKAIRRNTFSNVTNNNDFDETGPARGLAPKIDSHSTSSSHQPLNQRRARRRSSIAPGTSLHTNGDNDRKSLRTQKMSTMSHISSNVSDDRQKQQFSDPSIPSLNSKAAYPIRRAEDAKTDANNKQGKLNHNGERVPQSHSHQRDKTTVLNGVSGDEDDADSFGSMVLSVAINGKGDPLTKLGVKMIEAKQKQKMKKSLKRDKMIQFEREAWKGHGTSGGTFIIDDGTIYGHTPSKNSLIRLPADLDCWLEHCREPIVFKKVQEKRNGVGSPPSPLDNLSYNRTLNSIIASESNHMDIERAMIRDGLKESSDINKENLSTMSEGANLLKFMHRDIQRQTSFMDKFGKGKFSKKSSLEKAIDLSKHTQKKKLPTHRTFPESILRVVFLLPGNEKCCDCARGFKDKNKLWASITYGTLLCEQCSFHHIDKLEVRLELVHLYLCNTASHHIIFTTHPSV
jgi:hypothetical protein